MNDIEGFILAGGASRRMGRDKAQLQLADKTFIERAAVVLQGSVKQISVIGNLSFENLQIKSSAGHILNLPVLQDVYQSNSRAAIIGVHTALIHSKTDWMVVLACDLPFVTNDLLARLDGFRKEKFDAVVPLQLDGGAQPLCAFYRRKACLPPVEKMLHGGNWSLRKMMPQINVRFVEFSEVADLPDAEHFFFNVNTPTDYDLARKIKHCKN